MAPNEVIPKWGESSHFEFQFRLKNHLIWVSKMRVMCGSNTFQGYFDDAKESRVKQIPKFQESRIIKRRLNQDKY